MDFDKIGYPIDSSNQKPYHWKNDNKLILLLYPLWIRVLVAKKYSRPLKGMSIELNAMSVCRHQSLRKVELSVHQLQKLLVIHLLVRDILPITE